MGTSGAETTSISANIFVGQTEAPILIRPFINNMTNSELMAIMGGGGPSYVSNCEYVNINTFGNGVE